MSNKIELDNLNINLETKLNADIIAYQGPIYSLDNSYYDLQGFLKFVEILETLAVREQEQQKTKLIIFLTTQGGSAETVERMVEISRKYYKEIDFIIPHFAMSAGTLWALSGNNIYMDDTSSLGPLDPQIIRNGAYVPALCYIDKYNEMINKSHYNNLSHAEILLLQKLELAEISSYEQFRKLSISLATSWIETYNLQSNETLTADQKRNLAFDIGFKLSDNNAWYSHSRKISADKLIPLGLNIHKYQNDNDLKYLIRMYHHALLKDSSNIATLLIHNGRIDI